MSIILTVKFNASDGNSYFMFVLDEESGQGAKEVMTIPGVYDTIAEKLPQASLKLRKMSGQIDGFKTACFGLTMEGDFSAIDITAEIGKLMTMPATAANMLLEHYDEDKRDMLTAAMKELRFCEGVHTNDKLSLPREVFSELPEVEVASMMSARHSYSLKSVDNQEIFQKSCDAEYSVFLPPLEIIHRNTSDAVTAVDILRVIAPYRKETMKDVFDYASIYHTPYFKVDPQIKGYVPVHLSWITGYTSNDTLDIQANEQKMYNNLKTLICSDVSRYAKEILTGLFVTTKMGSLIQRLCFRRNFELANQICDDIAATNNEYVSCTITLADVDSIQQSNWDASLIAQVIKKSLHFSSTYFEQLLQSCPPDRRVVDCDQLFFVLDFTDEEEARYVDLMINMGFMSSAVHRFLVNLSLAAYRVNWGHTGGAMSIPNFSDRILIRLINDEMANYLGTLAKGKTPVPTDYRYIYLDDSDDSDSDFDFDFDSKSKEEFMSAFNYYVSKETEMLIKFDNLPHDYFSTKATGVQSNEKAVVEYWRTVNAEGNLSEFLSSSYIKTGDLNVFLEAFIKIMRWGERKPRLLVFQKHPEVRYVFDLNSGMSIDNTTIVDEADLVKVNGCEYSLAGLLCSNSNPGIKPDYIVGFFLQKDYGKVKKNFLASWVDLGEMVTTQQINIGEMISLTPFDGKIDRHFIEDFATAEHNFYVSDANIKKGIDMRVQAKDLSEVALLTTPAVTNTAAYLRSLKAEHLISLKDHQYDILHHYLLTISAFYQREAGALANLSNTIELSELAETFYKMWQNGDTGRRDANDARSASTIKSLNFGGSKVKFDNSELEGKFIVIIDKDMRSALPPIEFTDPTLVRLNQSASNRIVMFLLDQKGKYVFCRKAISYKELAIVSRVDKDGHPVRRAHTLPFTKLEQLFNDLVQGETRTMNQIPVMLHESLRDFV